MRKILLGFAVFGEASTHDPYDAPFPPIALNRLPQSQTCLRVQKLDSLTQPPHTMAGQAANGEPSRS